MKKAEGSYRLSQVSTRKTNKGGIETKGLEPVPIIVTEVISRQTLNT
jgi:hypothetical protein